MEFLADAMNKGGFFMWPILAAAVFAMAISCERLYMVAFRANINAAAFMAEVQKLVLQNNLDGAISLCAAEANAALARVLKAGLTRADASEGELRSAVDETIQGLIQAFDAVANATAESRQTLLADGIGVAMYTTFAGLVVAIPTLVLHSIIVARTTKIMDEVDQYALKTVNLLGARRRGAAATPSEA
jgi:biopolymer transport protein ExbB/TolQ